MGSKKSWFSSVKKVLSPDSEQKKAERANKSKKKKKWFRKEKPSVLDSQNPGTVEVSYPHPLPSIEDVKLTELEDEQTKHASAVAVVTAAAHDEDVAATQVTPEMPQPRTVAGFAGKSKEEVVAIKIQTAFRGYLARRTLRALRGIVRLKSFVDGPIVNRQTANTLKCMQALSRVQSQIQSRRIRMLEENRALQGQLLQKHAKELQSLKMGEEWDDSLQSKEQIEASLLHKCEAAMRRERALAYSYTHQQMWKKSTRSSNLLFMDPSNPHWGWSWLERWMAARPWETQSSTEKDINSDSVSTKSAIPRTTRGEITKSFARHLLNSENPSSPLYQKPPSSYQSPGTPTPPKAAASSVAARKLKPASPRGGSALSQEYDSRSILSLQSERNRRYSITGSSVRDDESLGSSMSVPSYMTSTQSAKVKSKLPSTLGMENGDTPEKGSAKKRLSFPPSPGRPRRHSGSPKVDTCSIAVNAVSGVAN